MIALLQTAAMAKPTTIDAPPPAAAMRDAATGDAAAGTVLTNIRHGEVFLRRKAAGVGSDFRLRWEPGDDAGRALPAGTYTVLGYRHVAAADDGKPWIWSTTSPGYRKLLVRAGASVRLDVRRTIDVRARAFRVRGQARVELAFVAEKGLGHTLYRDGARIAITWQCLDGEGAVLEEGTMDYG